MLNQTQELNLQMRQRISHRLFGFKRIATILAVWMIAVLDCYTASGQQLQSDQSGRSVLQNFSVLKSGKPAQVTPAATSAPSHKTPGPIRTAGNADAGAEIDQLITKMVLKNIPYQFEDVDDWGGQEERWDGIKFRREGLKIETQRRKKVVNHGTWKKYSAHLRNPKEEFTVQIKNMRQTVDDKLAFDVHFQAHLNLQGRQSKWVKGVQLYSVGVVGHTEVRLVVSVELEVKMGGAKLPPDLVFVPRATAADLVVDDFRIDRIGKVGGEFAQQVSRGVRSKLDEKIAEKEVKLVEKINRQLASKKSDLRISIADAIKSKWTRSAKEFLPDSIQCLLPDTN